MNIFVTNLLLAVLWTALMDSYTLPTFAAGFAIGFLILWVIQPLTGGSNSYFLRTFYWVRLVVMFHYELIVSSIAVVWDVLTPQHLARPGIIEVPLDVETETGLLLVTNLVSLTPGTLSVDVSDDRRTLLVHAMFADDPDAVVKSLKSGMERWVREAVET
ncbi:MAG: Na+/H+ antiporter subunit E [Pseudomonadota bacterium]